jgi:hypothetical protein
LPGSNAPRSRTPRAPPSWKPLRISFFLPG